jgi:integrase
MMRRHMALSGRRQRPPSVALAIRPARSEPYGKPYYEAVFHYGGRPAKRRVGAAWLDPDGLGGWRPRRGRAAEGFYDERAATVRADELVREYVLEAATHDEAEAKRQARGVTFREVAHAYLGWLENEHDAAPSTLRSHRSDLAEPGVPHRRGKGVTNGYIMDGIGDKPVHEITSSDVDAVLDKVAASGVKPRSVNRYRETMVAIFNFGMRSSRFNLTANPAQRSVRRRLPAPSPLVYFQPEDIEALARALCNGAHRPQSASARRSEDEELKDHQDAELARLASYTGLRLGELLALRWKDVDWRGSALNVSRAVSAGVERTTKGRRARRVPLADQAAAALNRLSQRQDFTTPADLVFCNHLGRRIDESAFRKRYKRALASAGVDALRLHDLRHTFGSLVAAHTADLVSVKDAMGHTNITTTQRYLHARPATERAKAFTAAFAVQSPPSERVASPSRD